MQVPVGVHANPGMSVCCADKSQMLSTSPLVLTPAVGCNPAQEGGQGVVSIEEGRNHATVHDLIPSKPSTVGQGGAGGRLGDKEFGQGSSDPVVLNGKRSPSLSTVAYPLCCRCSPHLSQTLSVL